MFPRGILFEHPQLHHHHPIWQNAAITRFLLLSHSSVPPSSPISFWAKHLAPIDQQTWPGRQSSFSWLRNPGRTTRVHSSKLFSLEFRTCQLIYRWLRIEMQFAFSAFQFSHDWLLIVWSLAPKSPIKLFVMLNKTLIIQAPLLLWTFNKFTQAGWGKKN